MTRRDEVVTAAKILVVDDDEATVQLYEAMLRKGGYQHVWTTRQASEVSELYRRLAPDLVLLDLHMGDVSGMDVIGQIQGQIPEGEYVPIVVITGDVSPDAKINALTHGAKDFLTKPVEWAEALLRIRIRLESRFRFLQMQRVISNLQDSMYASTTGTQAGDQTSSTTGSQAAVGSLLKRLDGIAELIDAGLHADARDRMRGNRWLDGLSLQGVPRKALSSAQQWIDTGYAALSGQHVDPVLALNTLLQARRVING